MTDWLRVRPRTELPGTEDVVLPPLTRLVLRDSAILSGTALSGLPRRDLRDVSCSTGGDVARSLIGDTLRERGGSGDDLRGPRVARPGKAFHCVSLDGDGATGANDNFFAVMGVASSFAMSKGLKPVTICVEIGGKPGPCGGCPGLALGKFGTF